MKICLCLTIIPLIFCAPVYASKEKQPLTVANAIETTRAMEYARAGSKGTSAFISPDGGRYVAMLIRGDLKRDGVEVELVSGELDTLEAAKPHVVAQLFTRGWGRTPTGESDSAQLTWQGWNPPVWIDNDRVALLWEDAKEVKQVLAVNVETQEIKYLTNSQTDVTTFSISPQGALIYGAGKIFSRDRSNQLLRDGYRVTSPDAVSLLLGIVDGTGVEDLIWGEWDRFVSTLSYPQPRKIRMNGGGEELFNSFVKPKFSPDGRFAIIDGSPSEIDDSWSLYTPPHFRTMMKEHHINPGVGSVRQLKQLFVLDVERAEARPLWNVPLNVVSLPHISWSPGSHSILLGPTFLPVGASGGGGLEGRGLAEVDIATGRFWPLPISPEMAARVSKSRWLSDEHIAIQLKGGEDLQFRKNAGSWRVVAEQMEQDTGDQGGGVAPVRIELRQGINAPPVFYAIENATGRERVVLDLNPKLAADFHLGRVRIIKWRDSGGYEWMGKLYYPINYKIGERYPLVIQTNVSDHFASTFSIYGGGIANTGPGYSVYLAQPLANRGVAVLQACFPASGIREHPSKGVRLYTAQRRIACYESAAEYLAAQGVVDRTRVGLMGHSSKGWHVEYAIAFSEFPYAAAIADDNISASYVQSALHGWRFGLGEDLTGAPPFGEGFKSWLENSPSFNAHRVRTPLLLQVSDGANGGGVGAPVTIGWEMFSRLRYLKKPVELYVAPNIQRGSHGLQNPTQVRAVQEHALDWWLFWLKNYEDEDPAKFEQYAHWRDLRDLRDLMLEQPRPPRLEWTATPVR